MEIVFFALVLMLVGKRAAAGGLDPRYVTIPAALGWGAIAILFGLTFDSPQAVMGFVIRWVWLGTILWLVWAPYDHEARGGG